MRRRPPPPPVPLVRNVLGGAAVVVLLTACTGDPPEGAAPNGAATRDAEAPILQPGRPGDAAATIGAGDAPSPASWNHSDVAFAQMMIPHHAQALEMSDLATERAGSDRVEALAQRIHGAQAPEILGLAAWLQERDMEVPTVGDDPARFDHGSHGHTPMAGMLTERQMSALEAARGREFDRLFLRGMIRHHRGAIEMAESVGKEAGDVVIAELAADVYATQTAEIDRMRELLDGL